MEKIDKLSLLLCIAGFSFWQSLNSQISFALSVPFFFCLGIVFLASGRLAGRLSFWSINRIDGFAFQFLSGYCIFNTLCFFSMLILPLGMKTNAAILSFIILIAAWRAKVYRPAVAPRQEKWDLYCVIISLVAATLWSWDSLTPTVSVPGGVIFKPWADIFYHVRTIHQIANWSGAVPLEDIALAGQVAHAHHFIAYTNSALLTAMTGIHSFAAFTGFHVPFGVFLTGLAAYVLASMFWNKQAGIAAIAALLLVPDAAQQGIKNIYFSYHWLQQIAPNGLYGIVLFSMSWIFMLRGCLTGNLFSILLSYFFLAAGVGYKAQLFVPNAILLWLWPAVFMRAKQIRIFERILWFLAALVILWSAILYSQKIPDVPTLVLDGSAFESFSKVQVIGEFEALPLREFFTWLHSFSIANIMALFIATFGFWGIISPATWLFFRQQKRRCICWVPVAVAGIYLSLAFFLAFNTSGFGEKDELIHRPFVWAYFIVATWTGSTLFHHLFQRRNRLAAYGRYLPLLVLLALLIPFLFGRGIQNGPSAWSRELTNYVVPSGLVDSCNYVRNHSSVKDIILDSHGDARMITSALCERQSFFQNSIYFREITPLIETRKKQVQDLRNYENITQMKDFLRLHRIDWYILQPTEAVSWAPTIADKPEFESGGYKVYRLSAIAK